ncbi:hypothetical protein BSZ35_04150 [Salinibacter sp. 10B]|nr:hypothetical protein BSZ35_04150 [Salinibacter sp. 10B]
MRRSLLPEGDGTATVKSVKGAEWSTTEAKVGEEITVTATAKGIEDGTPVTVQVKEVPEDGGPAAVIAEIETEVSGEEVEATWTKEYDSEGQTNGAGDSTGIPVYVAEVQVTGYPLAPSTGPLRCTDALRAQVLDDAERPLAKCPYKVILQSGRVLSGETDGEGKLEHTELPAGVHTVVPTGIGEEPEGEGSPAEQADGSVTQRIPSVGEADARTGRITRIVLSYPWVQIHMHRRTEYDADDRYILRSTDGEKKSSASYWQERAPKDHSLEDDNRLRLFFTRSGNEGTGEANLRSLAYTLSFEPADGPTETVFQNVPHDVITNG